MRLFRFKVICFLHLYYKTIKIFIIIEIKFNLSNMIKILTSIYLIILLFMNYEIIYIILYIS